VLAGLIGSNERQCCGGVICWSRIVEPRGREGNAMKRQGIFDGIGK
jgi:hypothetical protein